MDVDSLLAIGAVVVAGVSAFFAGRANSFAKSSVEKAEAANEIAGAANALAGVANHTAERSYAVARDQSEVDWRLELDELGQVTGVRNYSTQTLHDVRVIATDSQGVRAEHFAAQIEAVGAVHLELAGWAEHLELVLAQPESPAMWTSRGSLGTSGSEGATYSADILVSFETPAGAFRSSALRHEVRHVRMRGELERVSPEKAK